MKYLLTLFSLLSFFNGHSQWEKFYNKPDEDNKSCMAYTMCKTNDNAYLLAGEIYQGSTTSSDGLIIKVNENGDTIWTKKYSNEGYNAYNQHDVINFIKAYDDNYYLIGKKDSYTYPSIWFSKLNEEGDTLWTKTYGEHLIYQEGRSFTKTTNNFFVLNCLKNDSAFIIKTDSNGIKTWDTTFQAASYHNDNHIIPTQDSGFIIAFNGYKNSSGDTSFFFLEKFNSDNHSEWKHQFFLDSTLSINNINDFITTQVDSEYVITGSSNDGAFIAKVHSNGTMIWNKLLKYSGREIIYSIIESESGDYIFTGNTKNESGNNHGIWIGKISQNGERTWDQTYEDWWNEGRTIFEKENGELLVSGFYSRNYFKFYLLKTDKNGRLDHTTSNQELYRKTNDLFYPNPVRQTLTFNNTNYKAIKIFNNFGVLVYSGNNRKIDTSNFPSGLYTAIAISYDDAQISRNFIKL